jgi:hypothetical protein
MVCRELRWWRRRESYGGWTARTLLDYHKVDLSFTLEPGRRGGYINRNAILTVREKKPNALVATEVALVREFVGAYVAKNVIDALLFTCRVLKTNEEAYDWFMKQLQEYEGAPIPEQPGPSSRIYYPQGYEY